jgi:hypothetical protein
LLSGIAEAIDGEEGDGAEESSDFEELAALHVALCEKFVHVCIEVRDDTDRGKGADERPADDRVGVVALSLDEVAVTFF